MTKNILYAYANIDPKLGYSQGMNFIVYVLLKNINDEEKVFWCLYDIMYNKNWRLILKDETPKFKELVRVWRTSIYTEDKKLYKKLAKCGVPFLGIFAKFYISLFANICSVQVASRIFDVFLYEGEKRITQIIVKLFRFHKKKIMSIDKDDILSFVNENLLNSYLESNSISSLVT